MEISDSDNLAQNLQLLDAVQDGEEEMIHAKYFRSRLAELNYDHDLDR
jgi:hypothetical protein